MSGGGAQVAVVAAVVEWEWGARRLSSMYGLRHVDVKAILEHRNQLPDDDELKKEVNAQLASKEGRVSEKNVRRAGPRAFPARCCQD